MTSRRKLLRDLVSHARLGAPTCPLPPLSAFEGALHRWVTERCCYRERSYSSVKALHSDYVDWCVYDVSDVPCAVSQFKEWLGLQSLEVDGFGLVYGSILTMDLRAFGVTVH